MKYIRGLLGYHVGGKLKMDYKKIIKNQEWRFKILRFLRFIPDKTMISLQYKLKLGRWPDIDTPKRYTEKLQWYKLNYRSNLMTKCSDKYRAREYVESKGLVYILNKLYAVYSCVEEIKIDLLPDKFVMKTTNGSGTNIFCTDKSKHDLSTIKSEMSKWLSRDIYSSGREWSYKNVEPRIIVEEFLEDTTSEFHGINDYKFICFNGKPKFVVLDVDRHVAHKRNIYDINWNYINVSTDHDNFGDVLSKPEGYDELLRVAKILCEDFPCVRVDLYFVKNKVYFGELTFYPWTGYVQFEPDEFDYTLGKEFHLPKL